MNGILGFLSESCTSFFKQLDLQAALMWLSKGLGHFGRLPNAFSKGFHVVFVNVGEFHICFNVLQSYFTRLEIAIRI